MKTFFDLIQEVQKPGLCHRCGGCVTFCSAVNYGALDLDPDGKPRYGEIEKCIECGLCYAICPEIDELEAETRERLGWEPPIGRVIETTVARAGDPAVRKNATDGGVVTALLLHLFERGRIDGAIVTRQTGPFQRRPFLATSTEEIKDAAGFFFDTSHGMKSFGDQYLTFSSIEEFDPMMKKGLKRVALVGTPCQIKSVRRMQALGLVPAETIQFCFGLFCSGNFIFGEEQRRHLAEAGGFAWGEVRKINIKDDLLVHLNNGEVRHVALDGLEASGAMPAGSAPITPRSSPMSRSAGSAPRRAGPPSSCARRSAGLRSPTPRAQQGSRNTAPRITPPTPPRLSPRSAHGRPRSARRPSRTAKISAPGACG